MSKIEAYKCDACNCICPADEITGLSMSQDLFDEFKSYPLTPTPDKADIHFCFECYRLRVINFLPSDRDRMKNEYDYQVKKDNLTLAFKKSIIYNFNHAKTNVLRARK